MFEQLGLIGCGLMGGSFALALKRAGLVKRVVGYSKSPSTTERARQMGVTRLHLLTNKKCVAAISLYEKLGFEHSDEIMQKFATKYARANVAMRYPL